MDRAPRNDTRQAREAQDQAQRRERLSAKIRQALSGASLALAADGAGAGSAALAAADALGGQSTVVDARRLGLPGSEREVDLALARASGSVAFDAVGGGAQAEAKAIERAREVVESGFQAVVCVDASSELMRGERFEEGFAARSGASARPTPKRR